MMRSRATALLILLTTATTGASALGETFQAPFMDPGERVYDHDVILLDAAAVHGAAFAGGRLDLELLGKDYSFVLSAVTDDVAPDGHIETLNPSTGLVERLPVKPFLFSARDEAGTVNGLFGLNGAWVLGHVRTATTEIYLEPRMPSGAGGLVETVVYEDRARMPLMGPPFEPTNLLGTMQETSSSRVFSVPTDPSFSNYNGGLGGGCACGGGQPSPSPPPPVTARIDVDVDWEYIETFGGMTWPDRVRYTFGLVNERFRAQANLQFQLGEIEYNGALTSDDFETAWNQFVDHHECDPNDAQKKYNCINRPPWFTYFSGKDFWGWNLGKAPQPGGDYSMVQQVGDNWHYGYPGNDAERSLIVKHELGHNHNADHAEGDTWSGDCGYNNPEHMCDYKTIMAEGGGTVVDRFSSGQLSPYRNNERRLREFVTTYGI